MTTIIKINKKYSIGFLKPSQDYVHFLKEKQNIQPQYIFELITSITKRDETIRFNRLCSTFDKAIGAMNESIKTYEYINSKLVENDPATYAKFKDYRVISYTIKVRILDDTAF